MRRATLLGLALAAGTIAFTASHATVDLRAATVISIARQDSIHFSARLARDQIIAGETTTLVITLEARGVRTGEITQPELPPQLEALTTRDFTQLQFTFPGGRTRTLRREVVILAPEPGTFRIPPATARVRGQVYSTPELTLMVAPNGSAGGTGTPSAPGGAHLPGPTATARSPRDEVILQVDFSPDTVYVNQQITLVARTMIDENARLFFRRAPEFHAPDAPGFWTHQLPTRSGRNADSLHNRTYRVHEFQRAYFPLIPGTYTLPPARLEYQLRRGFQFDAEDRKLTTDSLRIVVLPLPRDGRPANFSGAIGNLSISARLEPGEIPVGEAAALIVEVDGIGNINALPPPLIPESDDFDIYPPTEEAHVEVRHGLVGGSKRFTFILIPRESGHLELPPITYEYFDPSLHEYRSAHADPLAIHALGAHDAHETDPTGDLHNDESSTRTSPRRFHTTLAIVTLAAGALALVLLRRQRPIRQRAPDPSPDLLHDRLQAALRQLRHTIEIGEGDPLRTLAGAIRDAATMVVPGGGPVWDVPSALADRLSEVGLPDATTNAVADLLARVEAARFRPNPPTTAEQTALLGEAELLLASLYRHASDGRGRRGARGEDGGAT